MEYETRVGEFSGPLEKLLELIEAEKMDINEVSLAKVTDDFLRYLEKFKQGMAEDMGVTEDAERKFRVDLRVLADFVSVASKLDFSEIEIFIAGAWRSRKKRRRTSKTLSRDCISINSSSRRSSSSTGCGLRAINLSAGRISLGAARATSRDSRCSIPGEILSTEALTAALGGIFETMKTYDLETETIREKIVTLEEKITEVLGRIQKDGDMHFNDLSGEKSRGEMIVVFLASSTWRANSSYSWSRWITFLI